MKRRGWCLVLGLLTTSTVPAAPHALVDIVQAPAWLERHGLRQPLVAGMHLENRDRIATGPGARVIVRLGDGSDFKLGEDAQVAVNALQRSENGVFSGVLDVKTGDLRLTSHEFREAPEKRAINVRYGEVIAAVRGEADLTGTVSEASDAVVLRDGRAYFAHPLAASVVTLATPLQVYEAPRGQAPLPVRSIDRFAGAHWALRTQAFWDGGTQQAGGRWQLRFAAMDKPAVLALSDQLGAAGFATRVMPVSDGGRYRYELRLSHLVTEREAQSLAQRLAAQFAVAAPAVVRR